MYGTLQQRVNETDKKNLVVTYDEANLECAAFARSQSTQVPN